MHVASGGERLRLLPSRPSHRAGIWGQRLVGVMTGEGVTGEGVTEASVPGLSFSSVILKCGG